METIISKIFHIQDLTPPPKNNSYIKTGIIVLKLREFVQFLLQFETYCFYFRW